MRLVEAVLRLLDAIGGLLHVLVLVDGVLDVLLGLLHVLLGLVDLLLCLVHALLCVLHAGVGLVEAILGVGDLLLGCGHLILLLRVLLGGCLVDRFLCLGDGLLGLLDRRDRGLVGHGRRGDGARDRHGCDRRCESLLVHIYPPMPSPDHGIRLQWKHPCDVSVSHSTCLQSDIGITGMSSCRQWCGRTHSRLPQTLPVGVNPSVRVVRTAGFSAWLRRSRPAVPRAGLRRTRDRGACPVRWFSARPRDRARRPACSRVPR